MGGCLSSQNLGKEDILKIREAKIRSRWIDEELDQGKKDDVEAIKLLFLGAGESGKSTMLKQMRIIHKDPSVEDPFGREDRQNYVALIHSNVLQSAKTLVKQSMLLQRDDGKSCRISEENRRYGELVSGVNYNYKLNAELVEALHILWQDPGIQATYELRSHYQLNDSTSYFFGRLDDVIQPDYLPDNQDILRARIRTTGIVEHSFVIEKNDFRMYDVGGQRNARKKWIHCFENVTSVIFVASLSAYDTVLYEDNRTNRMHEALNLFQDILSSRWFRSTSMILFLNKCDLFQEKIKTVSIKVCPDLYHYPGDDMDSRSALDFIKKEFTSKNDNLERKIYVHFTVATDTDHFKKIFQAVQSIILRLHLIDVGLMDASADFDNEYETMADDFDEYRA